MNSKWISDLNIKVLEGNIVKTHTYTQVILHDLIFGNGLLDLTPRATEKPIHIRWALSKNFVP